MKEAFVFNLYDVCQNPEQIMVYRSGHDQAVIKLAQVPTGQWCMGYDFDCCTGGAGSGANLTTLYASRASALLAGLDRGINWSQGYENWPPPHPQRHKLFTQALIAYKNRHSQLTLF